MLGVFKVVKLIDIPAIARLFNLRFINKVKNTSIDIAFKKLQLVV